MASSGNCEHCHGSGHINPLSSAKDMGLVYIPSVETNTGSRSYLATVSVDPACEDYGKVIHRLYTLHDNDELHHSGWNTCASRYGNPAAKRTKLILPSIGSSRIYVIDTTEDRTPKIHAVVEPAEMKALGVSRPHTSHCMENGDVIISTMGDENDSNKGSFVVLDGKTWKLKGKWGDRDVKYGYDFCCRDKDNALLSTGWGKPSSWWLGFNRSLLRKDYGSDLHVWDLEKREYLYPLELGDEGRMPMGIKFLHDPTKSVGFVACAFSSNIFRLSINLVGEWQAEKVIDVPDRTVEGWVHRYMPGVITDILISMDDTFLYFSNWIQGDVRQYDITDTRNPKLVGRLFLGGSMTTDSNVKTVNDLEPQPNPVPVKGRKLYGGPQMIQLSMDGKRLYLTDSMLSPWDKQFYPDMVKNGCVMLQVDCDTEKGGLSLNENFITDFGKEPDCPVLAHEIRYLGGDCSTDIYPPLAHYNIQPSEPTKYHTQKVSVSSTTVPDIDILSKNILEKSGTDLGAEFKTEVFASLFNSGVSVTSESTPPALPPSLSNGRSSNHSTPAPPHSTTEHSQPVQVAAAQPTKSQDNPRSHDGNNLRGSTAMFCSRSIVQLQRADNPWKPGVAARDSLSEKERAHIVLVRKFRGILNKITPTTFKTLVEKILQLPVLDEKHLSAVMILIYEKALNEPLYSKIYATICQVIAKEYKVKSQVTGEEVNFRKLLLIRCQKEFKMLPLDDRQMLEKMQNLKKALQNAQTDEEKARLNEEFKTFQTKARHRKLGYMRFLGELFLLQMLTVKIMHECMTCLLNAVDEESLEYLCQLWTTIGKVLDTNEKAKTYNDQYFAQMQKIATGEIRNVSIRIRFALKDVIELRQNHWVPRRDENVPKTLVEIHKQMAMEAAEKQVMTGVGYEHRAHAYMHGFGL